MSRSRPWSIAASMLLLLGAAAAPLPASAVTTPPVRYVVKTSSAAVATSTAAQVRTAGGVVTNVYTKVFPGFSATTTAAEADILRATTGVLAVTVDAPTRTATTQTSPPWGLDRIDQLFRPLSGSYTYDSTGAGVTAYVVDSGLRRSHSQFAGRASGGYDLVDHDGDSSDCYGHGTQVAGTIGGSTYGVAKSVKLVGMRVFDCTGHGYFSAMIAAVDRVLAQPVSGHRLINISGGGGAYPLMDEAVQRAAAAGIPVVVSAGNDAGDACAHSPARVRAAITVASTDRADTRAPSSNFGSCVDLFAPGVQVPTAANTSDTASGYAGGTSMAAAHVSGLVARLLQDPSFQGAWVQSTLTSGAVPGVVRDAHGTPNLLAFATNPDVLPPTMPQNTSVTANDATKQATLRWLAPASNGGSPITAYRVSRDGTDSVGVGRWSAVLSATARSQTFINLSPGVTYTLTVEALSAYFIGDAAERQVQISVP